MQTRELQAWQARLRFSDAQAADALGLSISGYRKQRCGVHPVSEQTALLTQYVEMVAPSWLHIAETATLIARRVNTLR